MRNALPLIDSCWLFAVTFSSFIGLDRVSRRICYHNLPRDSSGADWPVVSWTFFHFLKMDVTFPIFQSLGISSDCHDLSERSEASQWQETAFFLLDASCLIPFPQVLPDINFFYNGYCFTLTDSAHRLQLGTWKPSVKP